MFVKAWTRLPKNSFNILINFRSKHKWILPEGHDTGISVKNRINGEQVPLILSNKYYVKWYICGPTVYDESHVGHASCSIRLDIIRRILERFFDIKPVVALGITDIDDKIINRSNTLKIDCKSLAKKYELQYLSQLNELNVLPPNFILRVSDHIPEIIEFVSKIIDRGLGYVGKDGSVYFDTKAFRKYGKLVEPPEEKSFPKREGQKCSLDFALWKGAKENEPFWESPWGKGRPGWHIECSAMASKVFGSQLDLHSGGVDLVFPHHENEEAQSCCYHDCDQWVNYWLHAGELQIMQEKMSKSLKNYVSISEFLKSYTPDDFRMFCFISRYSKGLHYGPDSLQLAVDLCNKVSGFLADASSYIKGSWTLGNVCESTLLKKLEETNTNVEKSLRDDFDTAECFQSIYSLIKMTVTMLNEKENLTVGRSPGAVAAVYLYVREIFTSMGFQLGSQNLSQRSTSQNQLEFVLNTAVEFRNQVRNEAVSSKEKSVKGNLFRACDHFRDELGSVGVVIKDLDKNKSSWAIVDTKSEYEKKEAESAS